MKYRVGDRIMVDVDMPTKGTGRMIIKSWEHRKNDRGTIIIDNRVSCRVLCDDGKEFEFSCGFFDPHPCIRKIDRVLPIRRLKEFKL
jgi:hypothetical protein